MKAAAMVGAVSAAIQLFDAPDVVEVTDLEGDQISFSGCDAKSSDGWSFSEGSYSPDPFGPGDTLTVEMKGTVNGDISVQGVHVTLKWGAITLTDQDYPLEQGTQTYSGDVDLPISFSLPGASPRGGYTVEVRGYDDDSSNYNTCTEGSFSL